MFQTTNKQSAGLVAVLLLPLVAQYTESYAAPEEVSVTFSIPKLLGDCTAGESYIVKNNHEYRRTYNDLHPPRRSPARELSTDELSELIGLIRRWDINGPKVDWGYLGGSPCEYGLSASTGKSGGAYGWRNTVTQIPKSVADIVHWFWNHPPPDISKGVE
jgi:hypothetical protein